MRRSSAEHYSKYPPARKQVLLLSCMDLRLLDEIVQFMDHDGLTNRYYHVIFAGAALGALGDHSKTDGWFKTFESHLDIAYQLHHFDDVYVLEHRDCAAYKLLLNRNGEFGDSKEDQKDESDCHREYVRKLREKIGEWAIDKWAGWPAEQLKHDKPKLRVTGFLMGLRGNVEKLLEPKTFTPRKKRIGKKRRKK